jgi:hypothetical protein
MQDDQVNQKEDIGRDIDLHRPLGEVAYVAH